MDYVQPIDRSRAHCALTRTWSIPEKELDEKARKRSGLAQALSLYAGKPELPVILLAAEFVEDRIGGKACKIDLLSLQGATGLGREEAEIVCLMVGARQLGFREWSTAKPGEVEGPRLITRRDAFLSFASEELDLR